MNMRTFLITAVLLSGFNIAALSQTPDIAGAPEGLIIPLREQTLGAVVLGEIDTIHFQEGDRVEAGTLLLEMNTDLQELEVERRRLATDKTAELEFARTRVDVLNEELESTQKLYEKSRSVSREEINRKTLDYKMAVSELKRLQQDVELAEIEHAMAREELDQRRIRAPHTGILTEIMVEEGEICRPGQPLISMVDVSQCYLKCHLEPEQAESLEAGQPVTVVVPLASEQVVLPGVVDLIYPTVDAASGLRRVRILFDNPGARVSPGMAGYVLFEPPEG